MASYEPDFIKSCDGFPSGFFELRWNLKIKIYLFHSEQLIKVLTSHQMCQIGEIKFRAQKRLFGTEMVERHKNNRSYIE